MDAVKLKKKCHFCVWCFSRAHILSDCPAFSAEACTIQQKVAARCADAYLSHVMKKGEMVFALATFPICDLQFMIPNDFQVTLLQCSKGQIFSLVVSAFDHIFVFENVDMNTDTNELSWMQGYYGKLQYVISNCIYRPFKKARQAKNIECGKAYLDAVETYIAE